MDILSQSSLLLGVISLSLGPSVLARNVKNRLFFWYCLVCITLSIWALSFFLHRHWSDFYLYEIHLFFNLWIAPVALVFIRMMLRLEDDLFTRRIIQIATFLSSILSFSIIFQFNKYLLLNELILFAPVLIFAEVFYLMWVDRRLVQGRKEKEKVPTVGVGRRNFVYLGALFVMSLTVMDHIPIYGNIIPALGNILLVGYLFFISQAITHQRLLNFGALFSRFLVLTVVALTLSGLYFLLVAWIENSPGVFFLNSFIVSFLILMLLDPLRKLVSYLTHRLLTQKHLQVEQILRESQRRLSLTIDAPTMFSNILTTVNQLLKPQWAQFYLLRPDGTRFRKIKSIGNDSDSHTPREVLANHILIQYCSLLRRRGDVSIILDEIIENEVDRIISPEARDALLSILEAMRAMGGNLIIPIFDDKMALAFILVKTEGPPEPWGTNWGILQIIYPFFDQVSEHLKNLEVFSLQRERERLATLGQMSAGLAHEIRNPLGAIKGAVECLEIDPNKPEHKFLSVIMEETDRLNRVVTQFLDYSKPFGADAVISDLTEITEKVLSKIRPGISDSIEITFSRSSEPAIVRINPEQVQQVIINMVQNASKSLRQKMSTEQEFGPKISVAVDVEGSGKRKTVSISIEDNGEGIRKENLERLFIPFFTTSSSGTGLGLSISQKIIEAHKGKIEVFSEEGKFARFLILLPFEQK